ncbi:MAG: bifunctional glycosyltransferase family 2/GtrA family protein [Candidatus Omnitrophica bacterium]|nr:bifunctional glycosyltransferase family 2/GtrA family protein [Candidatus Omnitrophota bacterium]
MKDSNHGSVKKYEKGIVKFSVVVPCYNEETTVERCVERLREIQSENLALEILIVDDNSTDKSLSIANNLAGKYPEILVLHHERNQGKGAALRTGFQKATGDFVTIQDADLEYNPQELKRLLIPLINNDADVVIGSRFLTSEVHRVLYFWHYLGNSFLTLLSNMFTDLNLSDMETCYKVFRREVIQSINIEEDRFGFEPEIIAKIAHMRIRIYEMGISYYGRTYSEGKKIGLKDGIRALYCIFHYNAHKAPLPIQLLIYFFIGAFAAIINIAIFLTVLSTGFSVVIATPVAFVVAAIVNYVLCIYFLFRHKARWNSCMEALMFLLVVSFIGLFDFYVTVLLIRYGWSPAGSKMLASCFGFVLNFLGRRYLVFPELSSGPWRSHSEFS